MSREIVISEGDNIVAVIENKQIVEFILPEGDQAVGDIILGRVESIVPGIDAAFINIGRTRHGFIHVADLPASRGRQTGIKQYLRPKQPLIVQIIKSPTGSKGARLSGMVAIPGRHLVLTPFERRIGISRSIEEPEEKSRLARIVNAITQPGYGLIVRTEATGQSEADLKHDLDELISTWQDILFQSEKVQPPTVLYRDQDLMQRVVREAVSHDTVRLVIDREEGRRRLVDMLKKWSVDPEIIRGVQVFRGRRPLLVQYNILQELEMAVQPKVLLPGGGSLVIEPTEGLTVIDVNSGKLTSAIGMAETILQTNREAAVEIARQLRLRDIGGVIVVDFITMTDPRHQQIIWQILLEAIKADKAKPQLGYFSEHGLLEINRRRQRQSLREYLSVVCPTCQGVGRIRNQLFRYDILSTDVTDQRTALSAILKEAEPLAAPPVAAVAERVAGGAIAAEPEEEEAQEEGREERPVPEPRGQRERRDRFERGRRGRRQEERPLPEREEVAVSPVREPEIPQEMPIEEVAEPEVYLAARDDVRLEALPAAEVLPESEEEDGEEDLPEGVQEELAEIAMELATPPEADLEEEDSETVQQEGRFTETRMAPIPLPVEFPPQPAGDSGAFLAEEPTTAEPLPLEGEEEDERTILIEPAADIAPPPVVITTARRRSVPRGRRHRTGGGKVEPVSEAPRRRTTRSVIQD